METETTATEVIEFYRVVSERGITIWIIGGWGVDALLRKQTRKHSDLDILLLENECDVVVAYLEQNGYLDVRRSDTRPCNFVMGNAAGREIDFHVIRYDEHGNGLYGRPLEATFPAEALAALGEIDGVRVRCFSPDFQLKCHIGYDFDEDDIHDVRALVQAFDLPVPPEYQDVIV